MYVLRHTELRTCQEGPPKTMVRLETRRLFIDKSSRTERKSGCQQTVAFAIFFFCLVHFGFCVGGSCELKGYLLSVLETRICCPLKLMLKRVLLANTSNFIVHDGVIVFLI